LHILDYNRLVKDTNGLSEEEFLKKIESSFTIEKKGSAYKPAAMHEFGLYLNKQWYKLTAKESIIKDDPIGILDISILQENFLSPYIGHPRPAHR
jgi:uncharacterized protein (DUF1015 family)